MSVRTTIQAMAPPIVKESKVAPSETVKECTRGSKVMIVLIWLVSMRVQWNRVKSPITASLA